MLDLFHRLARLLHRARLPLWVMTAVAFGLFLASVLGWLEAEGLPLASFMIGLWAVFLIALADAFRSPPPRVDSTAGFASRLRVRIARSLRWVLAAGSVALFVFVVFLSVRSVSLLVGSA